MWTTRQSVKFDRAPSGAPNSPRPPRGFLVYLAAALTIVGLGASMMLSSRFSEPVDAAALSIATDASPAIEHLSAARGHLLQLKLAAALALESHPRDPEVDPRPFQVAVANIHQELRTYETFPFYPYEREHDREAQSTLRELEDGVSEFLSLLKARDVVGAQSFERKQLAETGFRLDQRIQELVAFNADQQNRMALEIPRLRARGARIGYVVAGATSLLALLMVGLFIRAEQRYIHLLALQRDETESHAQRASEFSVRLRSVLESSTRIAQAITAGDERNRVLQLIVDESRSLVGAQYSALGIGLDPEKSFDPWVHSGVPRETAEALRTPPKAVGVLGAVARKGMALKLDALAEYTEFHGLPARHPSIGPFLGLPIIHKGSNVASLFIARKEGERAFSEGDQEIAQLVAAYAGVALTNARLYDEALIATRAREDVLATVSHDLKNPLGSIRLSTQMLSRKSGDPGVHDLAGRIDRAAERMRRLIGDLLDAAKIEAGGLQPERHPEPVPALFESALEAIRPMAAEKSIRIYAQSPPSLAVLCDPHLILRVLTNLLGNAVKFSTAGDTIDISSQEAQGQVLFSVKDSGPGIAPDQLPHVFERYWQEKGDRRGTGLGLYIVKGIVEAHGGKVSIESVPGQGTTVLFTLPAAEGNDVSCTAPASDGPTLSNFRASPGTR